MVPFFKIQEYPKLAIVIPAFKKTFLKDALTSIAEQTNQEFKVYIGDDASPENLEEICAPFANQISLTYIKFDENIGSTSLVEHWARCIEMANEPWIWLFCDDDRMDSDCVDLFYTALKTTKEKFNLYRFNTSVINANNTIIKQRSNHPVVETGLSFAYYRLAGVRESYVTEYIFRKSTFDENSGFISFPAAWCSDDATWITLAGDKGIFTIEGPVVYWRKSRENIGGHNLFFKKEKLKAAVFFLDWFFAKYERQIK
ncbi:MAG: glycosyltransferase family 2 protein, partial [Nitrospinota bacterium]